MENLDKLIDTLAQDASTVNRAPHPLRLGIEWIMVALVYLAISLIISGARPDLPQQFWGFWFASEIVALLGILITTSISAALLAYPDLHQMRRIALAPIAAFVLFVLVMLLAWLADSPPAPHPIHSIECTLSITLLSLLPAGWTLYVMRRFASTHTRWAGGIAFLFSFSIGALWLRLYEHTDSISHVIEWHYLPMAVFGLIGMWLGKLVLKW